MTITPALLDLVVAGVVLEAVALGLLAARSGKLWLALPLALFLAAGGALLFAVRLAVAGAGDAVLGAALTAGFAAHAACLFLLFKHAPRTGAET